MSEEGSAPDFQAASARIKALDEERLKIKKKTYTKWINSFLVKDGAEVEDLFTDLADGTKLAKLLEIMTGEKLQKPSSGMTRFHKMANVNISLDFLRSKMQLESITAEDIVDGNPKIILNLIWALITGLQVQEIEMTD